MSDISAWIALSKVRGVGPRLMLRIHKENVKAGRTMASFVRGDSPKHPLSNAQATELRSLLTEDGFDSEPRGDDISVVTAEDAAYPPVLNALGDTRPPMLYYRGDLLLADTTGVAVVGSRKAGTKALEIAGQITRQLTAAKLTVVSGYAPGIDAAAHHAALESAGRTIAVLAFGLNEFRWRSEMRPLAKPGTYLLLTEYPPSQRWTVGAAMARNKIICSLSKAVIIVAARRDGGSIDEARTAVEQGRPLFVVEYGDYNESNEGNKLLLARGARPLRQDKGTGLPNVGPVLDAIGEEPRQTTMTL